MSTSNITSKDIKNIAVETMNDAAAQRADKNKSAQNGQEQRDAVEQKEGADKFNAAIESAAQTLFAAISKAHRAAIAAHKEYEGVKEADTTHRAKDVTKSVEAKNISAADCTLLAGKYYQIVEDTFTIEDAKNIVMQPVLNARNMATYYKRLSNKAVEDAKAERNKLNAEKAEKATQLVKLALSGSDKVVKVATRIQEIDARLAELNNYLEGKK